MLRESIFGENSAQFAKRCNISSQRMSNFENGYPISMDAANLIRHAVPGLTIDWLIHGDERALPVEMLNKLRSAHATKGRA